MFDFENLEVYKKAKAFNAIVCKVIFISGVLDRITKNQLRRASLSIVLNIAEVPAGSVRRTEEIFAL
jgi:four helix bundle protein